MDARRLSYMWLLFLGLALLAKGASVMSDDDEEEEEEFNSNHVPQFKSVSMNLNVTAGSSVTLPCSIDDLGVYVNLWSKDKQVMFTSSSNIFNNERLKLWGNYSLTIFDVGTADSGNYTCEISTNPPMRLVHHVQVFVPPIVNLFPDIKEYSVREGNSFSVGCTALGVPTPNITWRFKGERREAPGDQITVRKATKGDEGEYQCVADNGVGSPAVGTVNVMVIGEMQIHLTSRWIRDDKKEQVSAVLTCQVDAMPPVNLVWYKSNEPVRDNDRTSVTKSSNTAVLTISDVTEDDFGIYRCQAFNQFENLTQPIALSGLASPVSVTYHEATKDKTHRLEWTAESFSPIQTFKIKLRKIGNDGTIGEWVHYEMDGDKRSLELKDLEINSKHEVVMFAKNKFGWNEGSEPLFFTVMNAAPTGKAPSLPSSFLVVMAPILFFYGLFF